MCAYAFSKNDITVTLDEIFTIATQLKNTSYKLVRFTGGETLLHESIHLVIKAFKNIKIKTSLITNGYLLPEKYKTILDAGLNQIIVSIDGSSALSHDKYRKVSGLFFNVIHGINKVKQYKPETVIRVNTVVGLHNYHELISMYNLFNELRIHQWSIIPIKLNKNNFDKNKIEKLVKEFYKFQKYVDENNGPELLGYSKEWAGRNEKEILKFFETQIPFTPDNKCYLVDKVRFYIPSSGYIYPCNCVPHRSNSINYGSYDFPSAFFNSGLVEQRNLLRLNGSKFCKGCEPINAYLAQNPEILNDNILSF